MNDRLKQIFEIQKDFNKDLLYINRLNTREIMTKEFILAIISETNELLSEINWATWKKKREVIDSNICEEIIDSLKFLLNIAIIWGIDDKKLFNEFIRKSNVVVQRKKQIEKIKQIKKMNKKVCGIDLDGVIVDYPNCFIKFINTKFKKNFYNLFDIRKSVTNKKYFVFQDEYRKSGAKQFVRINTGAKEFIDKLKKMKYSIIVLTKRPYKQYFRIFADTKLNLDKNKIKYDAILFDDQKHKLIVKEFPNLKFMVEDNLVIANEVGAWGYKCFLIDNIYNQGQCSKNVVRVKSFIDILNKIKHE